MGFGYIGVMDAGSALISLLAVAIIVVAVVRSVAEWSRNNDSPQLTVPATVVSRRTSVTHHHHNANGAHHVHAVIHYHVTFEVASGDRMEFSVSGREYGVLTEGDRGQLSFQGTRYLGFERMVDPA